MGNSPMILWARSGGLRVWVSFFGKDRDGFFVLTDNDDPTCGWLRVDLKWLLTIPPDNQEHYNLLERSM